MVLRILRTRFIRVSGQRPSQNFQVSLSGLVSLGCPQAAEVYGLQYVLGMIQSSLSLPVYFHGGEGKSFGPTWSVHDRTQRLV